MAQPTITESLTRKLGPLPTWAWAAIPFGGYVAYAWWRSRSAPAVVDGGEVIPEDEIYLEGLPTVPTGGFNVAGGGSTATVAPPEDTIDSNLEWGNRAVGFLISTGVSPTIAASAIGKYLYGSDIPLNAQETAALNEALRKIGIPPEGVIVPPATTAPPTPTPVTPPPAKAAPKPVAAPVKKAATPSGPGYYRVVPGDTLGGIAKRYNTSVAQLMAWNSGIIRDPNRIIAGWIIRVR